jgi:hypothetical protein
MLDYGCHTSGKMQGRIIVCVLRFAHEIQA